MTPLSRNWGLWIRFDGCNRLPQQTGGWSRDAFALSKEMAKNLQSFGCG